LFIHPSGPNDPSEIVTNTATILTDTLSDGSIITLNRNSGLSIANGFNRKERRMALRGEAYFEVAPDKTRPFVVAVNDLEIKVVGTAFNVDNASIPGKVLIAVTHGKVLVSTGGQSLYLSAGEQAEYNQQTHLLSRIETQQNPNTLAYKNKVFQFNATPLREVVRQLNSAYGTKISLQNQTLEACPLTARYNNLGINRVLELIADSFSFKLEKNPDGTYVLSGAGCGE
jgi:transmembrane sensor